MNNGREVDRIQFFNGTNFPDCQWDHNPVG